MEMSWPALGGICGMLSLVLGLVLKLSHMIKSEFDATRLASEARAIKTHERIDALGMEVRTNFTPRDLHASDLRRIDDALREHAAVYADLSSRIDCPGAGRHR